MFSIVIAHNLDIQKKCSSGCIFYICNNHDKNLAFTPKSLFLIIYSTICVIFKHLFTFFRFSLEKCLTPYLIQPNIRPPLKRPYRLEA